MTATVVPNQTNVPTPVQKQSGVVIKMPTSNQIEEVSEDKLTDKQHAKTFIKKMGKDSVEVRCILSVVDTISETGKKAKKVVKKKKYRPIIAKYMVSHGIDERTTQYILNKKFKKFITSNF